MDIQQKKLVVFDLDGTLAESKAPMDVEMGELMTRLLEKKMVAIISGGKYEMFQHQLPVLNPSPELLKKLFFFPTTGAHFYRYEDGWKDVYADEIAPEDRQRIKDAFEKVYEEINYHHPEKLYGEVVEDRKTQVTFSACGQSAPVDVKKEWQQTQDRRMEIANALKKYLPNFEIRVAGLTSVDVTKKGIDKAYGLRQMEKHLGVSIAEMVFVGDALFEGGNDHAALKTGVEAIQVSGPEDTKKLIRDWLKSS